MIRRILHVGCGGDKLPPWLTGIETRLDISPKNSPDILASMTDMGEIGQFDVVYCSHSLEHLYPHEVHQALKEFSRVLGDGGIAVVLVPDLEEVRPTADVLFESYAGPITGLDLYYGHHILMQEHPAMAHHSGFVSETLGDAMKQAGFESVTTKRLGEYNLLGIGRK